MSLFIISALQSCFAGIMTALSASSANTAFLCFLSPAIFCSALRRSDNVFTLSLFYAFSMWLFSSLWIGELYRSGFVPSFLLSAAAAFGITLAEGLIFAACFLPLKFTDKKVFSPAFILCYVMSEYVQNFTFPWIKLAVSAAPFTVFIQTSSLFGSLFVSKFPALNDFNVLA